MKNSILFSFLFFFLFGAWQSSSAFTPEVSSYTTSALVCSTPTWPITNSVTQTTATFSWDPVAGAVSYSLQTRLPGGTWYTAPGSPFTSTTVTVSGFNPGTTYEWHVKANCSNGEYSNWTTPISFTTLGSAACNAPNWLNTTNITSTTATWQWASVSGAVSYSIQWRYAGGTWYNLSGGPWTNTWINVGGLQPATTYEWRVRSNCAYGAVSEWSYPTSFTTLGYSCSTPTWPITTNVTQSTATFSWDPVPGAVSYSVQTRLPGGTWYNAPGNPFYSTTVTIGGFTPGTTYEWRVRTCCGGGQYSNWTYPVTFTTLNGTYCNTPAWLYTTNITQNSATLDWETVSGATSYSVQWRNPGGAWNNLSGGPFYSSWASFNGLTPATTYEWRVRSNCTNGGYSEWSYIVSFTTLGYSCYTPTWPITTNVTQNSASFSWDQVSGAQGYTVQVRLLNGTWYDISGNPFYNTYASVYGLNPNTTYQWRVRANCGGGQYSNWTNPITFTTLGSSYCYAPNWLYTTGITQTSATLDWGGVSGAVSYNIQWRYPGGTWYNIPGGPFTQSWYNWNELTPCTTYEWRVQTNCTNGGVSAWSYSISFTTQCYSCNTPTWPITTNVTQTSASFSWDPVSGAQSYTVQVRLTNGTWYDIQGNPFYNTYATVNGLDPNTSYQWRVRANCGGGSYSNWTYPVNFTTLGMSCYAPNALYTTYITQTSATLDWSDVNGAQSYDLQWRYPGGTWYDVPGGPFTQSWHTISGLTPCTAYEWRVRSNCYGGTSSAWSYIAYFTTLCSSCNTPTWPITTNVTQTSASFSWDPVAGAQGYTVQVRLANGTWYDIQGNPFSNTYATVYGLEPNTNYEWRVRANCGGGQYSNWTYPISFTTSGGSCNAPTGLTTTNITQTTATWSWSPVSGAISYSVQWRYPGDVWHNLSGGPWTNTSLNVGGLYPNTTYDWRVRSNCANGMTSAWSDFTTFTTPGYSCGTPTWPITTNVTQTSATFSWDPVSGAVNYTVQTRLLNGTWYDTPGSPYSGTTATVNGLTPNTTYQWRVRANCGGGNYSAWTTAITFTTGSSGGGSGSDECSTAIMLSVNSTCMPITGSNIGATPSMPAPVGGCYSTGYKDVWFKFNMPNVNNSSVTIRTTAGSLTDGVMEVYTGADCAILSYITCEDDNNNGNGSQMPVINLTGSPNAPIWVRFWGYSGTTGTFNICVFDYISVNLAGNDDGSIIDIAGEPLTPLENGSDLKITDGIAPGLHIAPNPV
ncbi:MAG: fibronectin type III domain-containing protein, partial [Saprospiraceae bacterium]